MIYIVSGYWRSGTSLMMRALTAGGLDPLYQEGRSEELNRVLGTEDYAPNPAYFELDARVMSRFDFPLGHDGKLIKCLTAGIPTLYPMDYLMVGMWRHPEEIRQSYNAMTRKQGVVAPTWLDYGPDQLARYERRMDLLRDHVHNRRDMQYVEVKYRDELQADPVGTFTRLRDCGWPINVEAAASAVEPERCRVKLEALVGGC